LRGGCHGGGEDGQASGRLRSGLGNTSATGGSPSLSREGLLWGAGLVGAVADTVGPVGLVAEATEIVRVAGVGLLGNTGHVGSAHLLQWKSALDGAKNDRTKRTYSAVTLRLGQLLGVDGTSKGGSEDGSVLHLDGGGWIGRWSGSRSWIRIQLKVPR
jgi:hypothetical protein